MLTMCLTACGDSSSDAASSSSSKSTSESSSAAETTTTSQATSSETETTTTTQETTTTTTTTQETTTKQTSQINRVGIPYDAAKIIIANSNAKLAFTAVNLTTADLVSDGIDVGNTITDGPVSVESFANSTNPIEKKIYEYFTQTANTYGYVYIYYRTDTFDDSEPNFVQWSEEPTGMYIGQFPNPVDATNWSTIQFGTKQ